MIELSAIQRRELAQPEPVAFDPETGLTYFLIREDLYPRFRGFLTDDMPCRAEVALLVAKTMRENDANDPLLESYQKYVEKP